MAYKSCFDPPEAHAGHDPFRIAETTAYGRMRLAQQVASHNEIVSKAPWLTDSHLGRSSLQQLEWRKQAQMWQLSKLEVDRRKKADSTLAQLINRATSQLDNKLDAHVLRYKESRIRNPAWHPSWVDKVKIRNIYEEHRAIMSGKNVVSRVDAQPSQKAMQFRRFLRSSTHTAGGVPRKITKAKLAAFAARQNRNKPLTDMEVPPENPHSSIFGSTGALSRLNTASTHPHMSPQMGPREAGLPDWSVTQVSLARPDSRGNLPTRRGQRRAEVEPFQVSRAGTPMSEHRISTPSMTIEAVSGEIPEPPAGGVLAAGLNDGDSEDDEYGDEQFE